MRWSFFALAGLMSLPAAAPQALAAEDYAVLIISRERLEVPTHCEIGLYIQDQLAGRLFQEQATSFNLPPRRCVAAPESVAGSSPRLSARHARAPRAEHHLESRRCTQITHCPRPGRHVPQSGETGILSNPTIVPTLRVRTPHRTCCVPGTRHCFNARVTRSVTGCIPTQSVGTIAERGNDRA